MPKVSDNLTTQLLANRGLKTQKEIENFFNPSLSDYKKDLLILGIPNAQKRILKAIDNSELIIVYGDYDVDGVCASAIIYKALTAIGAKVLPYIPHREKEGYGLSKTGLEFVRDSGATLVITVDNGIVALEQAKFAKEIGLDLIITDHHLPLEEKPKAYEIVHSTKMCGAAVAWCLVAGLVKEPLAQELLQFTAIATITDLLPLLGLNRAFVVEGLRELNRTKNPGLIELIKLSGVTEQIGSYEIGHIIGPRLNAIGRLDHAIDALRLLCTKDSEKAKKLATLLCDANSKRQILTADAVNEAKILVNGINKKIHILDSKNWLPGIIGLVAARVCEEYYRPAIALSVGETHAKGSARSIVGINIVEVIRQCSDLLVDVGGHAGAAGFSLANDNIIPFKNRLERIMEGMSASEQVLEIEAEAGSRMLTKRLVSELSKFEPFGLGNPKPLLLTRSMQVTEIRTVGDGKHLKLKADGIDAIAFGMGATGELVHSSQLVDLVYNLELNKFNGTEKLQLKVKDIHIV